MAKNKKVGVQHLTMKSAAVIDSRRESNYPVYKSAKRMHLIDLTRHKMAAIERTLVVAKRAAQYCLDRFQPEQQTLWELVMETKTFRGPLIGVSAPANGVDDLAKEEIISKLIEGEFEMAEISIETPKMREGKPVVRVVSHLSVVLKLRSDAPLNQFQLPWVIKDGIYNKVADLLTGYAERMLDPHLAEKTTYPKVGENWPLVYQLNQSFKYFEHSETRKIYLYLPLFGPETGESLSSHAHSDTGPQLVRFGTDKVNDMKLLKRGILIPLQLDKHAETTFVRDHRHLPGWRERNATASARPRHQRYLGQLEVVKDFLPKRLEVFVRGNRLVFNVACEIPTKPPFESVDHVMGVAFGLEDLITVVVLDLDGKVIATHSVEAEPYEQIYFLRLAELKAGGGEFRQELAAFIQQRLIVPIGLAVEYRCQVGILEIGTPDKSRYSPTFNRRMSCWPYGKCGTILEYKLKGEGAPEPDHWYASLANGRCSHCGATNQKGQPNIISINKSVVTCASCHKESPAGLNAARNCAHFSLERLRKKK